MCSSDLFKVKRQLKFKLAFDCIIILRHLSDLFFLIFCAKHETQGDNNTHSTITLKLVCNPVYIHDTFKNNHNYLYTHTHIYIYIVCLLIMN